MHKLASIISKVSSCWEVCIHKHIQASSTNTTPNEWHHQHTEQEERKRATEGDRKDFNSAEADWTITTTKKTRKEKTDKE